MKNARLTVLAGLWAATSLGVAQLPMPDRKEERVLERQAGELFNSLRPVVERTSRSTVEVRVWRNRVSYGTVVKKNLVLSKWSEVMPDARSLSCRTGDGRWLPASVVGVYRDEDLVLLKVPELEAEPIDLGEDPELSLGSFLALVRPDGEAGAMGVVSVLPRSLRASDQGFLGISMDLDYQDQGVLVQTVEPGSAADQAGLKAGDVILKVNGREANGSFELRSSLQRVRPGEDITLSYRRGDQILEKTAKLGSRRRSRISESRMDHMNRLGNHPYSEVKDNFARVLQTDMQIVPEDCGAPVVTLDGKVAGIAIARAGRIKSYLIPVEAVVELLETEPSPPSERELARSDSPETRGLRRLLRRRGLDDSPESVRRHLQELRRLMEEMEEMEP